MTSKEELEMQKNRLEILQMSGRSEMIHTPETPQENMYLWQYELDFYKNLKKRERFYIFGAVCGIISLLLVVVIHFNFLLSLF